LTRGKRSTSSPEANDFVRAISCHFVDPFSFDQKKCESIGFIFLILLTPRKRKSKIALASFVMNVFVINTCSF